MSDTANRKSAVIEAAGTGTAWLEIDRLDTGLFDISVSGTFSGTITLQRKRSGETDGLARDVETFTAAAEKTGEVRGEWLLRLWCKAGDYTSGSAAVEVGT